MINLVKAIFEPIPQMTFIEFQKYIQSKVDKIKSFTKENNIISINYGLWGEKVNITDIENSKEILDNQELKNKFKGVWK